MSQVTLLMVSFKGSTIAVPISQSSSYDNLIAKVTGKWSEIHPAYMSFSYSIGEYVNISMSTEDDFPCLLLLIQQHKCSRVNVNLTDEKFRNNEFSVVSHSVLEPSNCIVDERNQYFNSPSSIQSSTHHASSEFASSSALVYRNSTVVCGKSPILEEEEEPFYDVCPVLSATPLLSDNWPNKITHVGQKFVGGVVEFRRELIQYAASRAFKYSFTKNNPHAVSVFCSARDRTGCKWRLAGTVKGSNSVFVLNKGCFDHTCGDFLVNDDTSRLTPKVCSSFVIEKLKENPAFSGKDVQRHIKTSYGFRFPYKKAWRTLQSARDDIFGEYQKSFDQLRWYGHVAKQTNPGTEVFCESDPINKRFRRFFIAFKASLDGFKHCRPMLFIDATSLKGKFKGQLLTAIGKDGNNGLFPVAFAIVDAETIDHWTFFLSKLKDVVKHEQEIIYLSDRHIGIMSAFPKVWEKPNNFFCLYHLYTNLKAAFRGGWSNAFRKKMVGLLKDCAYAPTVDLFNECRKKFEDVGGPLGTHWLSTVPPEKWAVSHAPGLIRFGELTTNAAESFNKRIIPIRSLPAAYLVDGLRQVVMEWYSERRTDASKWTGALCPRRENEWNAAKAVGRAWQIRTCDEVEGIYEVVSQPSQSVNLKLRTCTCFKWQLHGFPCTHAVNVICLHLKHISGIVHKSFFSSSYRQAYSYNLIPVPTSMRAEAERSLPTSETIHAPLAKPTAGRPKRKRIPSAGELHKKRTKTWNCPNCHHTGRHDTLICAANILNQTFSQDDESPDG